MNSDTTGQISHLRNELKKSSDEKIQLILLFIIGFFCYQHIPFSIIISYLLGLSTSLLFVSFVPGYLFVLFCTYFSDRLNPQEIITMIFSAFSNLVKQEEQKQEEQK